MTTNWVLAGRSASFPLLYHWRVLPGAAPLTQEHADVERVVEYWGGSAAVLDAFALVIASANEPPGLSRHRWPPAGPGPGTPRRQARSCRHGPAQGPGGRPASYLSETDYFQDDWQASFWGDHYARLTRVKDRYDPAGLFTVHHGVGSQT